MTSTTLDLALTHEAAEDIRAVLVSMAAIRGQAIAEGDFRKIPAVIERLTVLDFIGEPRFPTRPGTYLLAEHREIVATAARELIEWRDGSLDDKLDRPEARDFWRAQQAQAERVLAYLEEA